MGTANIASKLHRAIRLAENAELAAVASRDPARAERWAAERGVSASYGAYSALLSDPNVQAVYLPLPPSMHAEWTIKAAESGKHVLCEKPLAVSAAEAREMADACRRNGVQLMDGVMWVHHERADRMRAVLDSGALGDLRRVTAAFTFQWETIPRGNIRASAELGGGSLGDLGYYCARAVLWAFGETPESVFATARFRDGVDFNVSAALSYSGERAASFDCGFDTGLRKWFEIAGTKASIVCDDFTVPWNEESARFWTHAGEGKDAEHRVDGCVQEKRMIERFSRIVQTGELEPRWAEDALNTMRVCDAARRSAETGRAARLED